MNLYQIEENISQAMAIYEAGELSEAELKQALGTLESMTNDKLDNIASYIKNLNAEAKALKEEEENLSKRRKSKEKQVENLKNYVSEYLKTKDIKKLETARNVISVAKTPDKTVITDSEAFIEWAGNNYSGLLKTEIKADITKIKELLKEKIEIPFTRLESGTRLSIK